MKILLARRFTVATAIAALLSTATFASDKKYDPGASDTEIKLGQTVPHSGPGSLYGVIGRVGEAYFKMLNEKGGINDRKSQFLTG
jgi:ABC-type branched-subunit amino acid transport system substrate-binding protein